MVDRTARVVCPAGSQGGLNVALYSPTLLAVRDRETLAAALRGSARLSEQSERRLLELMLRFLRYVEFGCGLESLAEVTPQHVQGFVLAPSDGRKASPPSVATSHLRRSAVRLLYRVLRQASAVEHDPTLDLDLPARSSLAARPLTDDEIALGRSFSAKTLGETRRPAAWALAEATARTSELSAIRIRDVDLDGGRVWIAGSTKVEARWGHLSEWGVDALTRRIAILEQLPDVPLVYDGDWERRKPPGIGVRRDLRDPAPRRTRRRARCAAGFGGRVGGSTHPRADGADRSGRTRARRAQPGSRRTTDRLGLDDTSDRVIDEAAHSGRVRARARRGAPREPCALRARRARP